MWVNEIAFFCAQELIAPCIVLYSMYLEYTKVNYIVDKDFRSMAIKIFEHPTNVTSFFLFLYLDGYVRTVAASMNKPALELLLEMPSLGC